MANTIGELSEVRARLFVARVRSDQRTDGPATAASRAPPRRGLPPAMPPRAPRPGRRSSRATRSRSSVSRSRATLPSIFSRHQAAFAFGHCRVRDRRARNSRPRTLRAARGGTRGRRADGAPVAGSRRGSDSPARWRGSEAPARPAVSRRFVRCIRARVAGEAATGEAGARPTVPSHGSASQMLAKRVSYSFATRVIIVS